MSVTPRRIPWVEIEAILAREINAGTFAVGERLPTDAELATRFGVDSAIVHQALEGLAQRGLIRAEQGRGTVIHGRVLTYALSRRTRFARNLIEQGFDPATEKLLEEVVPAGAEVAARLGIPEWQSVAHRRGISRADGMPVEMGDAYIPLDRFPDFWAVRAKHVTYSATFAAYGVRDYVRQSTLIQSRMPTEEEAALLEQSPTSPIFVLTRLDVDLEGKPILFGRGIWSADRVEFDLTLGS